MEGRDSSSAAEAHASEKPPVTQGAGEFPELKTTGVGEPSGLVAVREGANSKSLTL
jgi:hypothetical protein